MKVPVVLFGLESRVLLGEEDRAEEVGETLEEEGGGAGDNGDVSDRGEMGKADGSGWTS